MWGMSFDRGGLCSEDKPENKTFDYLGWLNDMKAKHGGRAGIIRAQMEGRL